MPILHQREGRSTLLRTAQQWDQVQAGADTQRRAGRQDAFRQRLGALLASERYQHLDKETEELLLDEIPPLAFPPRGLAL